MHVTVTPLDERLYGDFTSMANAFGWKTSKFDHDDVDDITGKWFMTSHADTEDEARSALSWCVETLAQYGLTVERHKIEHVIFDTKRGDTL
jgi:hypothetical protein